jgi:cysteinyl-tRNA synthetase
MPDLQCQYRRLKAIKQIINNPSNQMLTSRETVIDYNETVNHLSEALDDNFNTFLVMTDNSPFCITSRIREDVTII